MHMRERKERVGNQIRRDQIQIHMTPARGGGQSEGPTTNARHTIVEIARSSDGGWRRGSPEYIWLEGGGINWSSRYSSGGKWGSGSRTQVDPLTAWRWVQGDWHTSEAAKVQWRQCFQGQQIRAGGWDPIERQS